MNKTTTNEATSGILALLTALLALGLVVGGCYLMAASTIAYVFGG